MMIPSQVVQSKIIAGHVIQKNQSVACIKQYIINNNEI